MRKKIYIALGIFAGILYVVLIFNRKYLKTNYPNDVLIFILNTIPNFLAGICYTYIFYKIILYLFGKKMDILAFFFTFGWLTLEEYYPIFSHSVIFDYNDILMSLVGGVIGLIIIRYANR